MTMMENLGKHVDAYRYLPRCLSFLRLAKYERIQDQKRIFTNTAEMTSPRIVSEWYAYSDTSPSPSSISKTYRRPGGGGGGNENNPPPPEGLSDPNKFEFELELEPTFLPSLPGILMVNVWPSFKE
jgi:hypothetical protein